ncbi:RNA polymerase sigma factor [Streptomyces sp. JV178]|uniref:RNA polymerase sigma factor n=1 Tax=Streptomyces sp. JV178 TaxID=858632 RepID=UPI0015D53184|nr:sigma-70 family RNA polymerase sigma factor [Streptomyces sp. JV178]
MADREGQPESDADLSSVVAKRRRELTCYTRRLLDRAGIPQARLDAEDVVQNALLKALQKERTEKIHNPRAYLYEVIRNQVRDESRRRNVPLALDDETAPGLVASSLKTVDETDRAADRVTVHAALSELPGQQRLVVWANKGLQYTHAEIADLLELSRGTVATHARRGLALLGVAVMSWVVTFFTASAVADPARDRDGSTHVRAPSRDAFDGGYSSGSTPAPTPEFTSQPAPDPGLWGLLASALELWPFLVSLLMLLGLVWAVRQLGR